MYVADGCAGQLRVALRELDHQEHYKMVLYCHQPQG